MIPFLDLKAICRHRGGRERRGPQGDLVRTLYPRSEVEAFEREFAAYCGVRHGIAVNSGTARLHLALLAAGVRPGRGDHGPVHLHRDGFGDLLHNRRAAVFVDVEPLTLTMDPTRIEAAITPRTKAIIPFISTVRWHMAPVMEIARRHGVAVVEDACQAHGAEYRGGRAGSFGLAGCFSFYPGKNLGAYGEGGMVVTDDDGQARPCGPSGTGARASAIITRRRDSTIAWMRSRARSSGSSSASGPLDGGPPSPCRHL